MFSALINDRKLGEKIFLQCSSPPRVWQSAGTALLGSVGTFRGFVFRRDLHFSACPGLGVAFLRERNPLGIDLDRLPQLKIR